jgi:hypothetical protein
MRFMVIVKATPESETNPVPSTQDLADMGKFNEELVKAGIMLAGEGLQPSAKGARIRFDGKKRSVIDGPFAEAKELVAGFWIWQVKTREEALEWAKRIPFQEGEVELRQVAEMEDFAAVDPDGELARKENELRKTIEGRQRS